MSTLPILQRRRERRLQHARSSGQRLTRTGLGCGLLFSSLLGLGIVAFALGYASLTADLPSVESLPTLLDPPNGLLYQPTRLYDQTGEHVLAVLSPFDEPRSYVPLDSSAPEHLPDSLVRITLALADPDFYNHSGYDWRGWNEPEIHPTLAQKLAADLLLWQEPPSLRRALRERILAAQITTRFGREKILEWHLNTADYGRHAYGADAAARLYFDKPVHTLNLAEATLLASVSQSPAINPLDAPQAAIQRAHETLDTLPAWAAASQDVESARQQVFTFAPATPETNFAPAFTTLALSQLEHRARIERGGMEILTSLDYTLQQQTRCALQTQLARLAGDDDPLDCILSVELAPLPPGEPLDGAASAVVLNPLDGRVLALVGEMHQETESAILTGHRPGTGLLPFIYLTGFSRGLSPASLVWDVPQADSSLSNLDDIYHGPVRARVALTGDYLAPAQSVLEQMGLAAVLQTMSPFGLQLSDTGNFAALLDGQNLVSPLAMARAYGVFAANGVLVEQTSALLSVRSIEEVMVWEKLPSQVSAVVSPQLSYLVNHVLANDSLGRPATLKLARSLDGAEAWALGYTPTRSIALWMDGGANPRAVSGLFSAILQAASQGETPGRWERPPGVSLIQVCDPSGLLPTQACPNLVSEVFLSGYEPVQADTLYKAYAINRETGLLATVFTPPELVEERIFMLVPPEVQLWAAASGLAVPPTTYDSLQAPPAREGLEITSPATFAQISGQVTIRGSAAGEGFAYYRLQYGQGLSPTTWVLIGENATSPITDGILGVWDTVDLQGLYALQLVLIYEDGRIESTTVQVEVTE
ncbi:MAG: transglycosylase domain-containing protein [Anaerolineae bacterium]|nr:transglycosylase domain-containing protein [Anaerolineae bacterium]